MCIYANSVLSLHDFPFLMTLQARHFLNMRNVDCFFCGSMGVHFLKKIERKTFIIVDFVSIQFFF